MNKQGTLDAVYEVLVRLRVNHPHGLRAIGSANAHDVLTRFGIDGQVAEMCSVILEVLEDRAGCLDQPMDLIELLADELKADGTLKSPFTHDCSGVKPGERGQEGLATHPDAMFTASNHNGRRFGIEADASLDRGGLHYYQDWRDADECRDYAHQIKTAWDAVEARFLNKDEIRTILTPNN